MAGIRVYELSKKINVSSKEIIARLNYLGIKAKSHMASIDQEVADKLVDIFSGKAKPETKKESKPKQDKKRTSPQKAPAKKSASRKSTRKNR